MFVTCVAVIFGIIRTDKKHIKNTFKKSSQDLDKPCVVYPALEIILMQEKA